MSVGDSNLNNLFKRASQDYIKCWCVEMICFACAAIKQEHAPFPSYLYCYISFILSIGKKS